MEGCETIEDSIHNIHTLYLMTIYNFFVSHHYDNLTSEIYKDNCSKLCINMKCNKLEKNKKLIQTQQAS